MIFYSTDVQVDFQMKEYTASEGLNDAEICVEHKGSIQIELSVDVFQQHILKQGQYNNNSV